jgi:hypothetical protein
MHSKPALSMAEEEHMTACDMLHLLDIQYLFAGAPASSASWASAVPRRSSFCSLPALAGVCMHALQVVFRHSAALACALAVFSISIPSGISILLLSLALLQLLLWALRPCQTRSLYNVPVLTATLMAWFLLVYLLQPVGISDMLPDMLRGALFVTTPNLLTLGPLLPAVESAAFLLTITACASHERAARVPTMWKYVVGAVPLHAAFAVPVQRGRAQLVARQHGRAHSHAARSATAPASTLLCQPNKRYTAKAALLPVLFAVHTAGIALIPVGWFSLGLLHICVCGAVFVIGPALLCAITVVVPFPADAQLVLLRRVRHTAMCACAALYLVAVLSAFLTQPTIPASTIAKLTGNHDILLQRDVAPTLAVFLLATAHAALGDFLQAALGGRSQLAGLPTEVPAECAIPEGADEVEQGADDVAVPLLPLRAPSASTPAHQASVAASKLACWIEASAKVLGSLALQAGVLMGPTTHCCRVPFSAPLYITVQCLLLHLFQSKNTEGSSKVVVAMVLQKTPELCSP